MYTVSVWGIVHPTERQRITTRALGMGEAKPAPAIQYITRSKDLKAARKRATNWIADNTTGTEVRYTPFGEVVTGPYTLSIDEN